MLNYIVLDCNRFIVLFTQIRYKNNKWYIKNIYIKKIFLILQCSILKKHRRTVWQLATGTCAHLWKFTTWGLICRGLTVFHSTNRVNQASLVAQTVKIPPAMQETWVRSLGWEDSMEKGTATHSSILAWKIPQTEEPGRLQSTGSQKPDTT